MSDPFADLVRELNEQPIPGDGLAVRIDPNRENRTGIPEIVFAENKTSGQVIDALIALADANGRAIASRVTDHQFRDLEAYHDPGYSVTPHPIARMVVWTRAGASAPAARGRIAVIAAGTSDIAVATEAVIVAREMGCEVIEITDVGVAGLHRLVRPLRHAISRGISAIVVAAGMDGALPSVVAGLVNVPVIGLPVSVGYGAGANGISALLTMLQSCSPGVVVVNIDNGIGAGTSAALIARQNIL